mgnify:CR=1 FL=1
MKRPLTLSLALAALVAGAGASCAAGLQWGERGFPGSPAPAATTWRQGCAQIQALVGGHGHAILTYRAFGYDPSTSVSAVATFGSYGYDRVVKDSRYCLTGEVTQPIWVRTRDAEACFAGFTCASGNSGRGRR